MLRVLLARAFGHLNRPHISLLQPSQQICTASLMAAPATVVGAIPEAQEVSDGSPLLHTATPPLANALVVYPGWCLCGTSTTITYPCTTTPRQRNRPPVAVISCFASNPNLSRSGSRGRCLRSMHPFQEVSEKNTCFGAQTTMFGVHSFEHMVHMSTHSVLCMRPTS